MYLSQQQAHASSLSKNSTPKDQPQRKPVGRWCLAGNVERPGVVGWQIEVVAVIDATIATHAMQSFISVHCVA